MLAATPDSYVWIYGSHPVAVVSAHPIVTVFGRPSGSPQLELGTKRLDDFFLHAADCFIGDPALVAWDNASLLALCAQRRARFGVLLTVDQPPAETA